VSEAQHLRLTGQQRHQQNDIAGALDCFRAALVIDPLHRETLRATAACYLQLGRSQPALDIFRGIAADHPADAGAHFDLAVALEACGAAAAARSAYEAALALDPQHFGARLNLCALLLALKDIAAAEAEGRRLAELHPDQPDAWCNLAQVLFAIASHAEADEALQRALAIFPGHAQALFARVVARSMLGDVEGALVLQGALRQRGFTSTELSAIPGAAEVWRYDRSDLEDICLTALFERFRQGDWACHASLCDGLTALAARVRAGTRTRMQPPQAFHAMAVGLDHTDYLTLVGQVSAFVATQTSSMPAAPRTERKRLRIGYLSPAFRHHPGAYLFRSVLAAHDRAAVEVFGYALNPDDGSAVRRDIVTGCDHFIDLCPLDDAQAAARICADGIDILVELEGYFDGARLHILAARPAALQVSYTGLLGIVEAPFIDYRFADRITDGGFASVVHAREQPAYLPGCFLPYGCPQTPWQIPSRRAEHGLPEGVFVFCALHNDYKLGPESFAAWMNILAAVPDSVLWLVANSERHFAALLRHAGAAGIAPHRLVRAPRAPNDEYLARLRLADLFLDTFAYNAHTTALDALWMELPVLTRTGRNPAARLCTSALAELGLHDMAVPDTASYIARAVELARSPDMLDGVRRRLHAARSDAVLFDPARKAAQLEAAYRQMWARHLDGLPSAMLDIGGA